MGQASSSTQIPPPHPPTNTVSNAPPPGCPMHQPPSASAPPAKCPVQHTTDTINPHNNMPSNLSQLPSANQTTQLPTDRASSSIPRADEPTSKWEYPSPQQFYNALVKKGWETPEEHVETMVEIHNFLNEEAWNEVVKWERRWTKDERLEPELARLHGKPGELSPKARMHLLASKLFPSRFNPEPPFDRHDWVVRRPSTGEEVRYIIDYYSAPDDAEGNPVFSLDVRPALDSVGSIKERIAVATEETWTTWKSSGGDAMKKP